MRFNYILYPEARAKLDSCGLTERIKNAHKEFKIQITGHMLDSEVVGTIKYMKDKGFFKQIPKKDFVDFSGRMQKAWKERDSVSWTINKNGETYREKTDIQDFLLFSGWKATELLPKKDVFNYKKFGFSSLLEFTGTLGAAIETEVHDRPLNSGIIWQTVRPDGRIFESDIGGDTNCDLRINQRELTPYETTDPLGNKVYYRPETEPDSRIVAAYHSNEGAFLVAILKYADQLNIKAKTLENKAQETIDWAKSIGGGKATCTEHFGGFDHDARQFLVSFDIPIPKLDKNDSTKQRTIHNLTTTSEGLYEIFIDKNDELVLAYEGKENRGNKKYICTSFTPQEVDHLVRGTLYQAAKGLGRTSVRQLIGILEYRFSDQMQKDMDEMHTRFEMMKEK